MNMMITDLRLDTELEAEGGRDDVVVARRFCPDDEDTFSIFPAYAEACLDHRGKHQNAGSLPAKLARGRILSDEALQRRIGVGVDLDGRGRVGGLRRRDDAQAAQNDIRNRARNAFMWKLPGRTPRRSGYYSARRRE